MAHLIETMAYAGEKPWHNLGSNIDADSSIEQWQVAAGLEWTVSKRPVLFQSNKADFAQMSFKDKFVLARDSDDRAYSVVSGRYKPVQPKEVLEFFRDLIQMHGMKIETAGSLKDGQRIWALAKTGDVHKVLGVDQVDSYLLLGTSYDLTFSTLAQFTSVRVVCNNTLQQSLKNYSTRVTIPHFRDFNADDIKTQLGIGKEAWAAYSASLDVLAKMKLDTVKAEHVIGKIFQIDPKDDPASKTNAPKIVHCNNVFDLFMGKAIGSDIAGQTGWGLLNGVTEYIDKHKRARNQGNRLDSAWFGDGANIKQRAYDELIQLAA
jgi:phage/plasmid-like protein (TIGR03299 family)